MNIFYDNDISEPFLLKHRIYHIKIIRETIYNLIGFLGAYVTRNLPHLK